MVFRFRRFPATFATRSKWTPWSSVESSSLVASTALSTTQPGTSCAQRRTSRLGALMPWSRRSYTERSIARKRWGGT